MTFAENRTYGVPKFARTKVNRHSGKLKGLSGYLQNHHDTKGLSRASSSSGVSQDPIFLLNFFEQQSEQKIQHISIQLFWYISGFDCICKCIPCTATLENSQHEVCPSLLTHLLIYSSYVNIHMLCHLMFLNHYSLGTIQDCQFNVLYILVILLQERRIIIHIYMYSN